MSPLIRTVRDLRALGTGFLASLLVLGAVVAVLIPIVRGDAEMLPQALAAAGLLLSNAGSLMAEPSRGARRATDPPETP